MSDHLDKYNKNELIILVRKLREENSLLKSQGIEDVIRKIVREELRDDVCGHISDRIWSYTDHD